LSSRKERAVSNVARRDIAIYEIFEVTERIRQHIGTQTSLESIAKIAREEGMSTLRESAIRNMLKGITTYSEVLRVTSEV